MTGWIVVIPVKGTELAKSRLEVSRETRSALALAFALDTVRAVLAAEQVAEVLVVTASEVVDSAVRALGAGSMRESDAAGLNRSIEQAIAVAERNNPGAPVAVLLGDLPALQPQDLDAALVAAAAHPRAMVADAAGVGTVLLCARDVGTHAVRFGGRSRAAHLAEGYVELAVDVRSGLRRDIDTVEDLTAARALPLGAETRRVLERHAIAGSANPTGASTGSAIPKGASAGSAIPKGATPSS
ncbi:2-phospho-L-lactate guanylyltransferase [Glaciihabitans tibetensis]|uniref:Phosphoenolpyruvate guanylyltransferase n=1 Tax=Glaciihabitans tibetensis TaxID=1266600 RepID=A0A2T0VI27_9MICO|nr:2-phospho-L-lactate guanylyltransferase [Glaciihabitans tibetensis]PRY69890.1 2-phospho-L-lactate guanylyltransferase [Glaciihabitans tibetensis]